MALLIKDTSNGTVFTATGSIDIGDVSIDGPLGQLAAAASVATTWSNENVALATAIFEKLPDLGQALAANSIPVVLPTLQASGLAQAAAQTDGTQLAGIRGLAKGVTAAVTQTVETVDANQNASHVSLATAIAGEDLTNNVLGVVPKLDATSTYAYSTDVSAALEASSLIKVSAGKFLYGRWTIDTTLATGTYYLQLINAASVPADGAITTFFDPIAFIHTTAFFTVITIEALENGIFGSAGLVWCISSTRFTKTLGTAVVSGTVFYK